MKDEANVQPSNDMASALGLDAAGTTKRRFPKWWLIAGAVVVVAILIGVFTSGGTEKVAYRLTDVSQGPVVATVTATGKLQPVNAVDIGPEISGQIETVLADFNDRVTQGQVLARMDTDTLQARVLQSRASLAAARARVEDAKATAVETQAKMERARELAKLGNASKQTVDSAEAADARARAAVGSAQAQVAVSQATLTSDETSLAKAEIRSPINGIVLSRSVEPGQVVAATFQTPVLFKLAEDLAQMQLEVDVDEADIGRVRDSQSATFAVDAFQNRQFPAKIAQVRFAPKTVDNVVTYQAVLTVDNGDLSLRPGMTATATIVTAARDNTLRVPNAALRFDPALTKKAPAAGPRGPFGGGGGPFGRLFEDEQPAVAASTGKPGVGRVWMLKGDAPVAVEVSVGISDGQFTEVRGGELKAGDRVITGVETPAAK